MSNDTKRGPQGQQDNALFEEYDFEADYQPRKKRKVREYYSEDDWEDY